MTLPVRLYFVPPPDDDLSPAQRLILDCLYTRHHDGYMRQPHARSAAAIFAHLGVSG